MNTLAKNRLTKIAETVNAEHAKIESVLREGLTRAVEVGKLLTEAKQLVKHGNWGAWIAEHCQFSERTAQNYMRIVDSYPELTKSATVADLTYREAIGLLADPKPAIDRATWIERLEKENANIERLTKLRDWFIAESNKSADETLTPARRMLKTAETLTAMDDFEDGYKKHFNAMIAICKEATQDRVFPLLPIELQQKAIDWASEGRE